MNNEWIGISEMYCHLSFTKTSRWVLAKADLYQSRILSNSKDEGFWCLDSLISHLSCLKIFVEQNGILSRFRFFETLNTGITFDQTWALVWNLLFIFLLKYSHSILSELSINLFILLDNIWVCRMRPFICRVEWFNALLL